MTERFSVGFSELVLIVNDVQASATFYREVVGLMPRNEADSAWAWFWTGEPEASQLLGLHKGTLLYEEESPHPEGQRWGAVHYAFRVPRERLEQAADHVRGNGIDVYGPQEFDWMKARSYYIYDPDGNLVELWSPED
ncbi:MAG: hypothetical protein DLM70_02615 [Chloroflexi bacterium]|nr:MAG: hypothetical protein DLM70_02615 [Chloroflexota bacterium]